MRSFLIVLSLLVSLPAAADKKSAKLAEARVTAAEQVYNRLVIEEDEGRGSIEQVCEWSARWFLAERARPLKGKALRAAAAAHLERMVFAEDMIDTRVGVGNATLTDLAIVTYYRIEAELWVARKGK
jgi:hypothetical protein